MSQGQDSAQANPRWWLPTLLMGLIWLLSSGARTPGPPLVHPLDWIAHFVTYLALGFSLGRATGNPALAWIVAAWFGALDEVHQAFVPPREAGITDWIFDLLGSGVGARLSGRLGSRKSAQQDPHLPEQPEQATEQERAAPLELDMEFPANR